MTLQPSTHILLTCSYLHTNWWHIVALYMQSDDTSLLSAHQLMTGHRHAQLHINWWCNQFLQRHTNKWMTQIYIPCLCWHSSRRSAQRCSPAAAGNPHDMSHCSSRSAATLSVQDTYEKSLRQGTYEKSLRQGTYEKSLRQQTVKLDHWPTTESWLGLNVKECKARSLTNRPWSAG